MAALVSLCLQVNPAWAAGTGLSADYYDTSTFTTLRFTRVDPVVDFNWNAASPSNTIAADTFSVRWYGQVEPEFTETYRFYVEADDGVRLWVNDRMIAVRTVRSAQVPEISGIIALQAGKPVNIRLEYIEESGNANVRLSWSSPSQPRQVIPQARLYPAYLEPDRGAILSEFWTGLTGTNISTLTNSANYPGRPAGREYLIQFECLLTNWADNYGTRVSGYLVPVVSGDYTIGVAASDTAQLYLSTNSAASNKVLIAQVPSATAFRQYTSFPSQVSAPLMLQAYQKYYVELLHKAGAGPDHFSVAWQPPGATNLTVVPAESLSPAGLDRSTPAQNNIFDTLTTGRPRLFATAQRFELLRRTIASNSVPQINTWWSSLSNAAAAILPQPPNAYVQDNRDTILGISRSVLDRIYRLAMVYRINGDTNFAERAWSELEAAANFPDWHPAHFLDTAEMTHAFAVGYDWLNDYWTSNRLATLRTAIITKGLSQSLTIYTNNSGWANENNNNWNLVCNGGMTLGALALGTDFHESTNEYVISRAVPSASALMRRYTADNGGWYEGPGYWDYTTDYNMRLMAGLESALGSDFNMSEARAVWETGLFAMGMVGPNKLSFNFADAGASNMRGPQLFWMSRRYLRPEYAWHERSNTTSPEALDLLWYDSRGSDPLTTGLAPDHYFRGATGTTPYPTADPVTFRTRWQDADATFVGFKSGEMGASHGNLDAGSFVLDSLGTRWAVDLGGDNYALPGYFGSARWTYYRLRAEGHNTLVINPGSGADQIVGSKPPMLMFSSEPEGGNSFAVADLTSCYSGMTRVWRGVQLLENRKSVLVQDEIVSSTPATVWWFMHFNTSGTSVQVDTNGSSVLFTRGADRLWAKILTGEATFAISNAVPLPTSPNPTGQNTNAGVQKLVLNLASVTNTTLAVLLAPLTPGQPIPTTLPEIIPLVDWSATNFAVMQPTNTPPTTVATNLTTPTGVAVNVDLRSLASDLQTSADRLLLSVEGPVGGTVALQADGRTARFTPAAGFSGVGSFRFVVKDAWPDSRMLAYYDFEPPEDLSDGAIIDGAGRLNNATVEVVGTGIAALASNRPAALSLLSTQSISFTERGDFNGARLVAGIPAADLDYNTQSWTAAGWFNRATSTNDDFIFYIGSSDGFGTPDEFQLFGRSGSASMTLQHYIGTSTTDVDITASSVALNTWHHFAVSFESTNGSSGLIRLYLNGSLVGTDTSVNLNMSAGKSGVFGGHGGGGNFAVTRWFNGRLDDCTILRGVLSQAEIAQLYARPAGYLGGASQTNTVYINVLPPNNPPGFASIINQTIAAGATLNIAPSASDPDNPPQRLLFSLLSAPQGATINPTNGVITWRAPVTPSGSSNWFQVVATENGWATTLVAVADAFVRDGSYGTSNYGSATSLELKYSASAGFRRESFVKFDLSGIAQEIASGDLLLYANSASTPGVQAVAVATNDAWSESSLTWNNRPDTNSAPVETWSIATGQTVAVPMTLPARQAATDDRTLSLRLFSTNLTQDGLVTYAARETGASSGPRLSLVMTNHSTLSATQSFWVRVNPPVAPSLSLSQVSGTQFQLVVAGGSSGPDYLVEGSTNLFSWQTLFTTNAPAFTWSDPDTNGIPQKFYRVRLGP